MHYGRLWISLRINQCCPIILSKEEKCFGLKCMLLQIKAKVTLLLVLLVDDHYYTMVWPGLLNPQHARLYFKCRILKRNSEKRSDFSFSGCVRKICLCWKNCIILCHCTLSNGILYPFEGTGASDAGKWKNCNTFLSFCLAILSQIRSRGVASVSCNTMRAIGLLGIAEAPL